MTEDDLTKFVASPRIMFCTDGSLHPTHPRGAGSFPRVLARYVRERHVLTLAQAIHKMTGLPAARMGFRDRGADRARHEGRSGAVRPEDGAGHGDDGAARRPRPLACRTCS